MTRSTVKAPASEKVNDGVLRTDVAPLISRFPELGQPTAVAWASGLMGTSAVGPSTYWIDAVVTLAPAQAQHLTELGVRPVTDHPTIVDQVSAKIPAGDWLGSQELDNAMALAGWEVHAYLVQGTDALVLSAKGGN